MRERVAAALLIHGAGGGGWEWNVWRGVLEAEGLRVAAPDLTPVAAGIAATGLDDYRRQVARALVQLPRPRAVIGASLGGLLAMQVAGDADALVLVNPLPPLPWHAQLPARAWDDVVPWRRNARLDATRRAMPDADDATAMFAFCHWRDESGRVLRDARAGITVTPPSVPVPVLCIASLRDDDVPATVTAALAAHWSTDFLQLEDASHVGPLLGRQAAAVAAQVAAWLSPR